MRRWQERSSLFGDGTYLVGGQCGQQAGLLPPARDPQSVLLDRCDAVHGGYYGFDDAVKRADAE